MSRWFRFYAEALDDPKVQKLDGETFKAWVNLLCLAARNEGFLPSVADVAFGLRIAPRDAVAVLERLLSATLLDKVSGGIDGYRYAPHRWHERQYKSDTSTERVKRFRKRSETVAVTPPDTETESDKKTPHTPRKRGADGKHLLPEDWQVPNVEELPPKARALAEQWPTEAYAAEGEAFVCYWRSERKMKADWLGTWANRVIDRNFRVMQQTRFEQSHRRQAPPQKFSDVYREEQQRKARRGMDRDRMNA